ncbi:hypothetical protein AVEN_165321-1 [Araneus ventricosus]|uniref:Uncharacterized protein n=1 Tax=Araneus ventricosus TaxID=182803 RepID=A0A4Y2ASX6_ARAVE|nr:hypothetical protein AVEN_165321-1 [Araneus ventricosus]
MGVRSLILLLCGLTHVKVTVRKVTYAVDLRWDRASSLEPFDPETLPLGHRGRGFETVPVETAANEIVSLAKIVGLEVENSIDELEEGHNQELTTEELTELHCASEQEVVEESLSEKGEVTAKQ